jgi:hypothetical protein
VKLTTHRSDVGAATEVEHLFALGNAGEVDEWWRESFGSSDP